MEHGVLLRFCLFILRGFDYGGHWTLFYSGYYYVYDDFSSS